MTNVSLIELKNERLKFSSAHFTIFSETERERLHGHNYTVHLALLTEVDDMGLSFDYRVYQDKIMTICSSLHQRMLLPDKSKYLFLREEGKYIVATFDGEDMPFLKSDVTVLPVTNITVEELSKWIIQQLIQDKTTLKAHSILKVTVKVHNGPGQSGSASFALRNEIDLVNS